MFILAKNYELLSFQARVCPIIAWGWTHVYIRHLMHCQFPESPDVQTVTQ